MNKDIQQVDAISFGLHYAGELGLTEKVITAKDVHTLLAAAILQERERCAAICDTEINPDPLELVSTYNAGCYNTAEYLANAIRNQGKPND